MITFLVAMAVFLSIVSITTVFVVGGRLKKEEPTVLPDLIPWSRTKLPLFLLPAQKELPEHITRCFNSAQVFWNNAASFTLFTSVEGEGNNLVLVVYHKTIEVFLNAKKGDPYCSDPRECRSLAFTQLHQDPQTKRIEAAEIHLNGPGMQRLSETQIDRAITHELGHTLGLAHDDIKKSVMYKAALGQLAVVTAADRKWLKGVYT